MSMKSSRSIDKVFAEANDELAILITRTKQLRRLTATIRRYLEQSIASHCYVASLEDDTLVLLADSAAWASQLRFHSSELLTQLAASDTVFKGVKQIKVKILQQHLSPSTPQRSLASGPQMNAQNSRGLQTLAQSIDDQALQDALTRLSRHAKTTG